MFLPLKTPFGLLTGLFNNLQVVATINYDTVYTLYKLHKNLFTLSSVGFIYLKRGSFTTVTELHTSNAHSIITNYH
jgi:hypothetical protein